MAALTWSKNWRISRRGNRYHRAASDIIQTERTQWNALLAQVGPDRMEIAGVEGTWSVKEIVAHLTWYERAVVDGARQVMSSGAFTRPGSGAGTVDERNARIAAASRTRPAADVLAEAENVFGQLLQVIAACPDNLLNDAKLLGLPDDIPPWMRVANNSYAHYREHAQSIQAWLARLGVLQSQRTLILPPLGAPCARSAPGESPRWARRRARAAGVVEEGGEVVGGEGARQPRGERLAQQPRISRPRRSRVGRRSASPSSVVAAAPPAPPAAR